MSALGGSHKYPHTTRHEAMDAAPTDAAFIAFVHLEHRQMTVSFTVARKRDP